jgi:hypothetical protein
MIFVVLAKTGSSAFRAIGKIKTLGPRLRGNDERVGFRASDFQRNAASILMRRERFLEAARLLYGSSSKSPWKIHSRCTAPMSVR